MGNAVLLHQRDEVRGRISGQGGFRKMRIRGQEIFRTAMKIREIAAASTGDQDLFAGTVRALQDHDAPAPLSGLNRAQQAGGSRAKNDCVKFVGHRVELRSVDPAANDYHITDFRGLCLFCVRSTMAPGRTINWLSKICEWRVSILSIGHSGIQLRHYSCFSFISRRAFVDLNFDVRSRGPSRPDQNYAASNREVFVRAGKGES